MRKFVVRALGAAAVVISGCHHRPPVAAGAAPHPEPAAHPAVAASDPLPLPETDRRMGANVVAHAEAFARAGHLPAGARNDCSGFVLAAYRAAGSPLDVPEEEREGTSLSAMLHQWSVSSRRSFKEGAPAPGDLVFFRDTIADRGLANRVTHVALVERVEPDGTVILIHYMSGRIRRDSMNLLCPRDPTRNGYLRKRRSSKEPTLAGELFVSYARFE